MNIRNESSESLCALVERLIASQFPQWADLPVRPVEHQGNDNRTFRLGERLSVRLPSAEPYVAAVLKEHEWLPRLAPQLPLPIPAPVALGRPGEGYLSPWSVCRWMEGETASAAGVSDLSEFAVSLAEFLAALQRIDATGGPPAGQQSFFRGASLSVYDAQTREAVAALEDRIDGRGALEVWDAALASEWRGKPVWFHGDVAISNLLTADGRLSGVLDFGTFGVGDPACDLTIAWTFLDETSRAAFKVMLPLDADTWTRGRGWAVWKCVIMLAQQLSRLGKIRSETIWTHNPVTGRNVLNEVIADHRDSA